MRALMNGTFHNVELPTDGTPLSLIGRTMDTPNGKVVVVAHVTYEGDDYISVQPEKPHGPAVA